MIPIDEELLADIKELLNQANISQEQLSVQRCSMGGNNRTYRVQTRDGVFLVKKYFSHPADLRDRLGAEFSFLSYAKKVTTRRVPTPYAENVLKKIALYEFIEGSPLRASEITEEAVNAAIEFFCELNAPTARAKAMSLGNASESCFTLQEHFELVQRRIQQIQQITPDTFENEEARHYAEEMARFWVALIAQIQKLEVPLTPSQRCISPSDFGFHNALKAPNQRLYFLDFEYAGWDDPGKMVGDFFAQIAVPVPGQFFDLFVCKTMGIFPESEQLVKRAQILRPVYQIKWCCIALNVFLSYHLDRRKFASENTLDVVGLQRAQLSKVQRIMESLKCSESLYGLC